MEVLINSCINLAKANLALGVKNSDLEFSFIAIKILNLVKKLNYIAFLDLANF